MFDDFDLSGILRWRRLILGAAKVIKGMQEQEDFLATMEEFGVVFEKLPQKLRWRIFDLVEREITYRKGSYEISGARNTKEAIVQQCFLRAAAISSLCLKGEVVYENRRQLLEINALTSNEIIDSLMESVIDVAAKGREPTMDLCIYRSVLEIRLADPFLWKRLLREVHQLDSPIQSQMEKLVALPAK